MPELVKDKVYVVINAINFNELTTSSDSFAYTVFNRFTHWYYFEESDIFAPSKFIGYENTTLENYRRETGRHGGKTEKLLTHWFEQLDRDSSYFAELSTKLFVIIPLTQQNKSPILVVTELGDNRKCVQLLNSLSSTPLMKPVWKAL